jgi:dihydroxyacid dehydratase/phosphogluconate dehydratase
MEDFFYAGGLPGPDEPDQGRHLHLDVMTVTGQMLGRQHRARRGLR